MSNQPMNERHWQEIRAKALLLPDVKESSVRCRSINSPEFVNIRSLHIKTKNKSIITLVNDGTICFEGDEICVLTPAKMLMLVLALLPPKE